jgi:hypothetical protein
LKNTGKTARIIGTQPPKETIFYGSPKKAKSADFGTQII